jgi:hypothetical protein
VIDGLVAPLIITLPFALLASHFAKTWTPFVLVCAIGGSFSLLMTLQWVRHPGSYLELTSEGVVEEHAGRLVAYFWDEVEEFVVVRVRGSEREELVGVRYSDCFQGERLPKWLGRFSKCDATFTGDWGIPPTKLCRLLNDWRLRYSRKLKCDNVVLDEIA